MPNPKLRLGDLKRRRKGPPVLRTQRSPDYSQIEFFNLGNSSVSLTAPDTVYTPGTSKSTASWTPPTSGLIILWLQNESALGTIPNVPTVDGNGIRWYLIDTVRADQVVPGGNAVRLSLWAADAFGSVTGPTTFTKATAELGGFALFSGARNVDMTAGVRSAFVQTKMAGSDTGVASATITLDNATPYSTGSRCISAWYTSSGAGINPRDAWQEQDGPDVYYESQFRADAFEATAGAIWPTTKAYLGGMAELRHGITIEPLPTETIGPVPAGVPHKLSLGAGLGTKRQGPPILARQRFGDYAPADPNVTITVGTPGAITFTGSVVGITTSITPTVGDITFTGSTVGITTAITPGVGDITFTGSTVGITSSITPTPGAITFTGSTGITITTTGPVTITVDTPGAITFTGSTVAISKTITPTPGVITFTGSTVAISKTITPTPGAITFTGQAVGITTAITPTVGAITFTGQAVGISKTITPSAGALTLAGQAVAFITLLQTQPGAITFTGSTGIQAGSPITTFETWANATVLVESFPQIVTPDISSGTSSVETSSQISTPDQASNVSSPG